jgi:hypothetical protein
MSTKKYFNLSVARKPWRMQVIILAEEEKL